MINHHVAEAIGRYNELQLQVEIGHEEVGGEGGDRLGFVLLPRLGQHMGHPPARLADAGAGVDVDGAAGAQATRDI